MSEYEWIPPNNATLIGLARSAWIQAKKQCRGHICFFYFRGRLITFAGDALKVSDILKTPTGKDSKDIPFTMLALNDDLNDHFEHLRNAGYKVAIAELKDGHHKEIPRQMELF